MVQEKDEPEQIHLKGLILVDSWPERHARISPPSEIVLSPLHHHLLTVTISLLTKYLQRTEKVYTKKNIY